MTPAAPSRPDPFARLMPALLAGDRDTACALLREFLAAVAAGGAERAEVWAVLAALSATRPDPAIAATLVTAIEAGAQTLPCRDADWGAVNIVGTGGGIASFNISSTAAVIAAVCGVRVLKSGSAAYSSAAGAIEFLRAAGIVPVRSCAEAEAMLDRFGIAFYTPGEFSPLLKRLAMAVMPRPLKTIAPVLNRVGPCLRLLPARSQLTGVARLEDLDWYAEVFGLLGQDRVTLIANEAGLDEGCAFALNRLRPVAGGEWLLDPARLGLGAGGPEAIRGGDAAANLALSRAIFAAEAPAAPTEVALLNAALLICTAEDSRDLPAALERARAALDSGAARTLFAALCSAPMSKAG